MITIKLKNAINEQQSTASLEEDASLQNLQRFLFIRSEAFVFSDGANRAFVDFGWCAGLMASAVAGVVLHYYPAPNIVQKTVNNVPVYVDCRMSVKGIEREVSARCGARVELIGLI